MKVLIYAHRIGSKTITFIHNEINQLAKDNEVLVLYHHDENVLQLEGCQKKKIRHYHNRKVTKALSVLNKLGLNMPSFMRDFRSTVNDFKPDVIHIHFGTIADRVLIENEIKDIPVFISFHGYDASRSLRNASYVERLGYLFSLDNVHPIFVSHFMLNNVKTALGVDDIPGSCILYYGTDLSFFSRTSYPENEKKTFLQVSSFVEKKGHKYTVEAIRRYLSSDTNNKNVRFILAGGGNLLDEIKAMVEGTELEGYIEFTGWIDKAQAKTLMTRADYFLHHSIVDSRGDMEGIPNAIMEAMAMELPVLSTVHSGIPELVEDGVNGFLVAEKDVEKYAQRIGDIQSMGYLAINREKVLKDFEMEKHRDKLLDYYKRALGV